MTRINNSFEAATERDEQVRNAAPDMLAALREIARIGEIPPKNAEDCKLQCDAMWNIALGALAEIDKRRADGGLGARLMRAHGAQSKCR
jgi:hypothetical protein